jgi:hypothetical protein
MLYETPYPTEPQNDLVPAQTERNEEIQARYEAGETGASLAQIFDISEQRVHQIIRGRQSQTGGFHSPECRVFAVSRFFETTMKITMV